MYRLECYNKLKMNHMKGDPNMISVKPLKHLLVDRDMTYKQLYEGAGFSKLTMTRLMAGDNVTLEVIDKICSYLDCSVSDIIEYLPE